MSLSTVPPCQYPPLRERVRAYLNLCRANLKKYWWHMLIPIAVILVAQHWVRFDVNYTESLHHRVYLTLKRDRHIERDGYVTFYYRINHPGTLFKDGDHALKRVCGIEGDRIEVDEHRHVWLHEQSAPESAWNPKLDRTIPHRSATNTPRFIGYAKETSQTGVPVHPIASGVIPEGKIFVCAPHRDSLDSKYEMVGLVDIERDVMGRAIALF